MLMYGVELECNIYDRVVKSNQFYKLIKQINNENDVNSLEYLLNKIDEKMYLGIIYRKKDNIYKIDNHEMNTFSESKDVQLSIRRIFDVFFTILHDSLINDDANENEKLPEILDMNWFLINN